MSKFDNEDMENCKGGDTQKLSFIVGFSECFNLFQPSVSFQIESSHLLTNVFYCVTTDFNKVFR